MQTSPRPFEPGDFDRRAVDPARAPAVDAVEAAGHGHPATAMSPAPAAHLLFQRLLRHDPGQPGRSHRDRPGPSCGHTTLTRYVQPAEDAARGGYVLAEAEGGTPEVVLIGTGGEVHVALDARTLLAREGIAARVVSMPCLECFQEQGPEYREHVLPRSVRARVSVEAGSALGWYELLGDAGIPVRLDQFGAGAPHPALHEQHGFTAERVAATARASLARAGQRERA
ncbi:transketolase C-terminal domain-containing protein [Streptomyces sp. NPDC006430]|uniref:transketolase-like TK C-terminal-containing protein n=1 Tax=Streptomyces sp. NPDC006430 TaxID=3154299 RepID=UPI0033A8C036